MPVDCWADILRRIFGWVIYSEDWQREVRRFRTASMYAPKKNGKSPTAAGIGLYLLCRDGEQGQKVYSAAKDGLQAGIMHRHAVEMVKRSATLSEECAISAEPGRKKEVGRIVHGNSSSFYTILAGDNFNSQEGLNGSVIIDETHVVDERLAKVLKYAGASREEPLHFEVSTAGRNPQGYGKKRWDYGMQVRDGTIRNDRHFFEAWAAPQDATDEQLDDPKVWESANPTWGKVIRPEEFRASFDESRRSPTDFAEFKMYRLNIWQTSANPYIKRDDWLACGADYSLDQFNGCDTWLGLDLSRTRDMTAAVFAFKGVDDADTVWLWPIFFMPEEEARDKQHLASYLDWAQAGELVLTEGNVISYGEIEQHLLDVVAEHNLYVRDIRFDERFAEELTQRLADNHWGCDRTKVNQTRTALTPRIDDLERCVIARTLRHPRNSVLTWQAGHVECDNRFNGKLLTKPENEPHKKIDGFAATVNVITDVLEAETYDDSPVFS